MVDGKPYRVTVIEISCVEVWREISNYAEDDIDAELRLRLEAHLRGCAHCKAVLDGTQNIIKLIADGVEYDLPAGFSSRLYQKIETK